MPLPDKHYFSLEALSSRWKIPFEDLRYYAEHEDLHLCCWLDLREVVLYRPRENQCKFAAECRKFEGYVGIHARDCRKVFRRGRYRLVNFICLERKDCIVTIPPQSREVVISIEDLQVTRKECQRFEEDHGLEMKCDCTGVMVGKLEADGISIRNGKASGLVIRTKTREFHYDGEPLRLGSIQGDIIKQLAEARQTGMCWMYGKTLLYNAKSQAVRMRDIFKSNSRWQEIMESDRRGHYRIRENIPVNIE